MKKSSVDILNEHLQTVKDIKEIGTDDFFYTRLKARMENERNNFETYFSLKPIWIISSLVLLLVVNFFILTKENKEQPTAQTNVSTLQNFAAAYDQTITSY